MNSAWCSSFGGLTPGPAHQHGAPGLAQAAGKVFQSMQAGGVDSGRHIADAQNDYRRESGSDPGSLRRVAFGGTEQERPVERRMVT